MPINKIAAQTSHLEGLAKTIAVPNLNRPHRLPTFPNLERTATLAFTDTHTIATPSGGTLFAVLTRDPAYPLWISTALPVTYQGSFYKSGSYVTAAASTGVAMGAGEIYDVEFAVDDATLRGGFFATVPYLRREGHLFFPLGGNCDGSKFSVALEANLSATAGNNVSGWAQLELLSASLEVVDKRIPFTLSFKSNDATPPTYDFSDAYCYFDLDADYVGVRFVGLQFVSKLATNLLSVGYGITSTNPVLMPESLRADPLYNPKPPSGPITRLLPFGDVPEASTTSIIWQSTRATAVSVLLTNVTPVLEKEGTVSAARIPCGNSRSGNQAFNPRWWTGFQSVHPRDRYFGALEKGLYTYTLPDVNSEMFADCLVSYDNNFNTDNQFPVASLDSFSYVNCMAFVDGDATRSTALAVTLDRHLEFRTTSRVFPTDFSKEALETYHGAQMALTRMGVFMENPVHLATIAGMASQAVRALWPIVKPFAIPAAQAVSTAAVNWAKNKIAGSMEQAGLTVPKQARQKPRRKAKAQRAQKMRR